MTTEPATYAPAPLRNGLGIVGLIVGIVAMPFGLVPLTFWVAVSGRRHRPGARPGWVCPDEAG